MKHKQTHNVWRRTLIGAAAGAMSLLASGAFAGDCPADRRVADGKGEKPAIHAAKDVTDVVRTVTDLRQFRLRQLDIKPGHRSLA